MLCFPLFLFSAFLNSITSLHREVSEISLRFCRIHLYHVVKFTVVNKYVQWKSMYFLFYICKYIFLWNWTFQREGKPGRKITEIPRGGGIKLNNPPWEGYGYFLEPHNELLPNTSLNTCLTENPRHCIA